MTYSILIVDDEPDNFEVIEALLESENYILHYASRGQEALAALETFNPDAILLDVMMPGIDGIEVCKRIKAMPQWQAVPIIMVTALNDKADLARCIAAGADDFVSKPVNGIELRARVQSMLRIKKQHDRIQSLSRLQRNNIHFLENSLHELHLDLAVSFPDELNAPLHSVVENIKFLESNFTQMSNPKIEEQLKLVNRSAIAIEKLTKSFVFYLQLSLPSKSSVQQETCESKILIEQLISSQIGLFEPSPELVFDLDNAELAVTTSHLNYIVSELFDLILNTSKNITKIDICGRVIDNAFHFCIDGRTSIHNSNSDSKLSELIQLTSKLDRERELSIGLKIVKKIIEIYDGLFLLVTNDLDEQTIYITLPLVENKV